MIDPKDLIEKKKALKKHLEDINGAEASTKALADEIELLEAQLAKKTRRPQQTFLDECAG